MSVLEVVEWPAKVLETKSEPVTEFDDSFREFVQDMHDTMDSAGGIGLAANQVGIAKRVFVVHIPFEQNRYEEEHDDDETDAVPEVWHNKRFTLVNPKITKKLGKFRWQEGCLSFPEIYEFVDRAEEVWISAQDEFGKEIEVHGTGLFSVCLQHELDHIDGIVFFNRMSRLKASMVKKKMLKRGHKAEVEMEPI